MLGREIFADTSGWGNLADPDEPFHKRAKHLVRLARAKGIRLITTNYVLAELVSLLLSFRIPHANIRRFRQRHCCLAASGNRLDRQSHSCRSMGFVSASP